MSVTRAWAIIARGFNHLPSERAVRAISGVPVRIDASMLIRRLIWNGCMSGMLGFDRHLPSLKNAARDGDHGRSRHLHSDAVHTQQRGRSVDCRPALNSMAMGVAVVYIRSTACMKACGVP